MKMFRVAFKHVACCVQTLGIRCIHDIFIADAVFKHRTSNPGTHHFVASVSSRVGMVRSSEDQEPCPFGVMRTKGTFG